MSGNIYFVRHGETHWNNKKIMHGQYDIPLNDTGIKQARQVAKELKDKRFDICICSPLERARTTAIEILKFHPSTKIIFDNRLMEINKGLLEGQRRINEEILKEENAEILKKYQVESKAHFYNRVSSVMSEIISNYKDKNILVVSHSGTTKMALFYFDPPSEEISKAYYKIHIPNCSYRVVKNEKPLSKPILTLYNTYSKTHYNTQNREDNKMKIGVYPMVADILHTGHMVAIEEAKKHCDYLIVALHCCPNYKKPIQTIYERYMQLRAVKWVDEVIPYENVQDAENMLLSLDYDVYFLGEDHEGKNWECSEVVKNRGKEVVYLSRKHPFSSTYVKERLETNEG